jgi:hypothetical protein
MKDADEFFQPQPQMHGLVLTDANCSYTDMTKVGRITIGYSKSNSAHLIGVDGFVFSSATSCRDTVTKALCWARDLLDAAIQCERLVPGGPSNVMVSADLGWGDSEDDDDE